METTGIVLTAVGQTLALVGATTVAASAFRRIRKKSPEKVTWQDVVELDRFVDRRLARDAIGWGAGVVLLGLAAASLGAWLLVLA